MIVAQQTRCYKEVRDISEANLIGLSSSIQNENWIEVYREDNVKRNGIPFTLFLIIILI
jgi:hypothetical protein